MPGKWNYPPFRPQTSADILQDLRDMSVKFEQQHADWLRSCHISGIEVVPDASVTRPTLYVSIKDYELLLAATDSEARRNNPVFCCPDCNLEMGDAPFGEARRCGRCWLLWTSERGFYG